MCKFFTLMIAERVTAKLSRQWERMSPRIAGRVGQTTETSYVRVIMHSKPLTDVNLEVIKSR